MDMAYNQDVKCDFRVSSWDEFYEVVKGLEVMEVINK